MFVILYALGMFICDLLKLQCRLEAKSPFLPPQLSIALRRVGDPVGSGLVASLAQPGGNVTGFPVFVDTMAGKWLEFMREIAPRVERVGFLFHPDAAPHRGLLRAAQSAAPLLNIKLIPLPIHNASEIVAAITAFASEADGLPGCGDIAAELRDELLNGEIFYSLKEAQIVIEQWRKHYNTIRPHSALNYRPPAPQTFAPLAHHLDEIMPMQ